MTKCRCYWAVAGFLGVAVWCATLIALATALGGCGTAAKTKIEPATSSVTHEQSQPSKTVTTRVRVGDPKGAKP